LKNQNVIFLDKEVSELATEFGVPEAEILTELETIRVKLFQWRNEHRPRPHLDNKFIASWNGLMTAAFAQAGFLFSNQFYIDRAVKAIAFMEKNFFVDGDLLRTCYSDKNGLVVNLAKPIPGCVDDFANVIGALLDVFQATMNKKYLELALKLQKKQDELFWDDKNGGYFISRATDTSAIVRLKDDDDGAEPSSNSSSLINLMRFNAIFPGDYEAKIDKILHQFEDRMSKIAITLPLMTAAFMSRQEGYGRILLVGKNLEKSPELAFLKKKLFPLGTIILSLDTGTELAGIQKLIPGLLDKIKAAKDNEIITFVQKGHTETKAENMEHLATLFDS